MSIKLLDNGPTSHYSLVGWRVADDGFKAKLFAVPRVAVEAGGKRFDPVNIDERLRLKQKEAELLKRLLRLKRAMKETQEMETLASKGKLFKEAQKELRRLQARIAGIDGGDDTK